MDDKYVRQFKKGSLEMVLLCLIARKETYGYELITELNKNGLMRWGMRGRNRLSDFIPAAGGGAGALQSSSGCGQRRI